MTRTITLLVTILFFSISTIAQVTYVIPEPIQNENINIDFQKVKPTSSKYYINYKIKNIGEGVLFIDRKKAMIKQNKGSASPYSGNYSLKKGASKTIYNEIKAKAPVQPNAEVFQFILDGLSYANLSGNSLESENLIVAEKATQTIGDFHVKVMEYNVYPERKYVQIKVTFNGNGEQAGKIDLTKLTITGGNPEIVKKGDVLLPGKTYTFSINLSPNNEELTINWDGVFNLMTLSKIAIDAITIKSTTYKEEVVEVEEVVQEETSGNCELSFGDFSMLKTDIETEMNSGGKPVEMANEFLLEKGCISTIQVLEYLGTFNLDGTRLKFAKMAYKYCSDKQKYHMTVGKMAYTKNKQALEEFLEQQ